MAIVKIPEILRHKLSDNGADALVDLLSEVEKSSRDNVVVLVEEKFERRLTEEISELRSRDLANLDRRITEESANLDKRITEETTKLRTELIERISQSEVRIIRWMFLFWIGQIAVVAAILSPLLRK